MIIVSACLAGVNCRYDGKNSANEKIIKLIKEGKAILVCPEQLAGMTTPREPIEIKNGKIINKKGEDFTEKLIFGCSEALKIAKLYCCEKAILKSRSPTCGCGKIYDGIFTGKLIAGDGLFAKMLKENDVEVISEEEI